MSGKFILYVVAIALLILLAFTRVLDTAGHNSTEAALQRALTTFAIARALNGVISVAQGTELAIEPAGVGVVLSPGEILDPINDLVERFSWVMLTSSASLGIINILLSISAWLWLSLLMSITLLLVLYLSWKKQLWDGYAPKLIVRLALVMVVLRFAAPLMVVLNDFIYLQFLSSQYVSAMSELDEARKKVAEINTQQTNTSSTDESNYSFLDQARTFYESTTENLKRGLNLQQQMESLNEAVKNASRATIDLIVIFVFQTILLPLIFIWVIWHLLKSIARLDFEIKRSMIA